MREKKLLVIYALMSAFFVSVIWLVKLLEWITSEEFVQLGILPRHLSGLIGIVAAPLIHSGLEHLLSNSLPLFFLLIGLFYFYKAIAYKIFFLIWLMSGMGTWIFAREAYHIGASGLIYGLVAFLLFSGFIRGSVRLMAISFLVIFLYGSLVWGVFPVEEGISWEGHLFGALTGMACAIYYRREGPQRKRYDWEDEQDEEENETVNEVRVNYVYKKEEGRESQ